MSGKAHHWRDEELRLEAVKVHPDLQMRVNGVDRAHVNKLQRVLEGGQALERVKVARVGKALYLLDGFHRHAAHEGAGCTTIAAQVAKMSKPEAEAEAMLANTKHGKGLRPADKAQVLSRFVKAGMHLDERGAVKSCRRIAGEINHVYSHETVRQKLKALGVEMDEAVEFPGGYKPWEGAEEATEDELAMERAEAAQRHLEAFRELYPTLEDSDQRNMLVAARSLVEALGNGERTERATVVVGDLPDI